MSSREERPPRMDFPSVSGPVVSVEGECMRLKDKIAIVVIALSVLSITGAMAKPLILMTIWKPVVRTPGRRGCNCSTAGHITDMPSAAGYISRPDRNDVRYVDPHENGVSPWPTVGLARVDAPPGGDDKTAELPVVILIVGSFGTLTEWFGGVVHSTDQSVAVGVEDLLSAMRVNVGWEGDL